MSDLEQIKSAMRRIPEVVFSKGDLDVLDEVVLEDYVEHVELPPGSPQGRDGLKALVTMVRAAFPDFHYLIEDEIAEADRYVLRCTAQGTHKGDFQGIPATGRFVSWEEVHIARVQDGKLAEHWAVYDTASMLRQLGAIPQP